MAVTNNFSKLLKYSLVWISVTLASASWAQSNTEADKDLSVELPFWRQNFKGLLGGKEVEVALTRLGEKVDGQYCYLPCEKSPYVLRLEGKLLGGGHIKLTEHDLSAKGQPADETGQWSVHRQGKRLEGRWRSSDGSRTAAVNLSAVSQSIQPFPYEIRLVASHMPEEGDGCDAVPSVDSIRLYLGKTLIQELLTSSQGTCSMFFPEVIDANFDGWPDLMLAQFLPAAPNIPEQYWLYNQQSRRFDDAPASLQVVTSPVFDPINKTVWSAWRASCCEHGVTTYRWKDNVLVETDSRSSYYLPVLDGKRKLFCYVIPEYDKGQIVFRDRVEKGADSVLRLNVTKIEDCETDTGVPPERVSLEIWHRDPSNGKQSVIHHEDGHWERTITDKGPRYCPNVPFFAGGHILRLTLTDDLDRCDFGDLDKPDESSQ